MNRIKFNRWKGLICAAFLLCSVIGSAYIPSEGPASGVVYAAGNMPAFTVSQTLTTSGKLPDSLNETGIYELVSVTDGAPLPDGAQNGVFRFTLTGNDTVDIPVITGARSGQPTELFFEQAGQYQYTIHQVTEDAANYSYDRATYSMNVMIVGSGSGTSVGALWIVNEQGAKPEQITFSNSYTGEVKEDTGYNAGGRDVDPGDQPGGRDNDTSEQNTPDSDKDKQPRSIIGFLVKTGDDMPLVGCIALLVFAAIAEVIIIYYRHKKNTD